MIDKNEMVKISDFGTSREWDEISTKMSFAGTVAWMAPEVIRNENCSEKVDIWSFGIVLWELLTCEIPYKDVDSSAIIWGVGNNSLHLPIPSSCPEGFKLLIKQCWSVKPKTRPSFKIIMSHLEIAGAELIKQSTEQYFETQQTWREEIRSHMEKMASVGSNLSKYEQDLIKKRKDEWKHAQDIRLIYQRKLERTNTLYMQLSACFLHLEEREKMIAEKEKHLPYKAARRTVFPCRKVNDKLHNRRRYSNQSSPTSPEHQTTTPSPDSTPSVCVII